MFSFKICENEDVINNKDRFTRVAVRGVILKGENILLVKSNRGDYKFPGGGVKKGENHKEALIREVEEETGYRVVSIEGLIGEIQEISKNKFNENGVFIMDSYYYKCRVTDEMFNQSLDNYEKELGFVGEWVELKEAINNNERIIKSGNPNNIDWLKRETLALKNIYEEIKGNKNEK